MDRRKTAPKVVMLRCIENIKLYRIGCLDITFAKYPHAKLFFLKVNYIFLGSITGNKI